MYTVYIVMMVAVYIVMKDPVYIVMMVAVYIVMKDPVYIVMMVAVYITHSKMTSFDANYFMSNF
jgi:hypothetical protein